MKRVLRGRLFFFFFKWKSSYWTDELIFGKDVRSWCMVGGLRHFLVCFTNPLQHCHSVTCSVFRFLSVKSFLCLASTLSVRWPTLSCYSVHHLLGLATTLCSFHSAKLLLCLSYFLSSLFSAKFLLCPLQIICSVYLQICPASTLSSFCSVQLLFCPASALSSFDSVHHTLFPVSTLSSFSSLSKSPLSISMVPDLTTLCPNSSSPVPDSFTALSLYVQISHCLDFPSSWFGRRTLQCKVATVGCHVDTRLFGLWIE